jgi:hypothetical protein
MPACALCENVQAAGEACDVCGHPFPVGERTPVPVEPLEGLEATSLPPVEAPAEPLPELEATSIDPVQVVVAAMEGLQPTEAEGIPDDGPAEAAAAPVCRYCRNPAPAGEAFCVHCGMRLPATVAATDVPREVRFCSDCGTPVRGASCPGCGARLTG